MVYAIKFLITSFFSLAENLTFSYTSPSNASFLGAFAKLRKAAISFVMSVHCLSVRPSARNNSAPTGLIFMNCDI